MQEIVHQLLTILRGMWKFRWPAIAAAWVFAVVATVVIWRIPDQYEASARIQVDTDSILKPLMNGLAVQPNIDQQIAMLSRTLISRPNLERLVRMADLDLKNPSKAEQEHLIERLQKGIEIRTAGGANLYSMAYRDADADKAKRVIQSMVSMFVESGLGASRKDTDSAKSFLNEQIKTVEGKLEDAEARLKEFRLRNIDRQGADGKDAATRIGEISAQLDAARLQLSEAERSREAARRQLAETKAQNASPTISNLIAESTVSVSTSEIDGRIDALKKNLDGLLQRYTEQHPDVIAARRLIEELEQQRRKEVLDAQRRLAGVRATTGAAAAAPESLAQQELGRVLASAEVQVAAMQARVEEYSRRYAQAKEQLKTAPQIEAEAAQLNRDYAIMRKNYDELVARRQSAVMSGELDVASGITEFRLIDPPRVSPRPVSPNRLVLFPAGVGLAVVLGLLVAFAGTQLRPTFADGADLRQRTGLPLLGTVTMLISDEDRQRQRAGLIRFAGASGGLVMLTVVGMAVFVMTNH